MTRVTGWLLVLVLVGLVGALRWQVHRRADNILRGEALAIEALSALTHASDAAFASDGPHPGLSAILSAAPRLRALPDLGDGEVSYAHDEAYLYGLALSLGRDDQGAPQHGWVLRAWPREFGVTGDVEFHISERGPLVQGQNDRGRSGTENGFPPPFPEPSLGDPGNVWKRLARPQR